MKGISKPVRIGLIVFFLGVAVASSIHVLLWAMESYDSSQTQQELQQLYHQGSLSADSSGQELVPGASGSQQNTASDTQSPDGMTMLPEYQALYEINSDIVGWVNIGNGLLSTPVMQRDNEYYLTHNFYGEEDNHGQVFLDERNSPDLSDDNTILYGHNITSDRSMFNVLTNFRDPEFVAENPVIQVNTLYQKYEYAVAAVYLAATRPEHGEIFDYINYLKFSTQDAKEAYIAQIEKRSMLDTGVELTADDKLLTFSTCSYEFADARLVVVARRLRDGETAEETPAVCNCTEKCAAGAVNTACPVCAVNMAECTGQEPEPTPDPETEPEPEQEPAGLNPAMLLVVLAVLGGIGALVYFKFIKQKPKTKGSDNLDDYDYGEDDTEQEDEDPWETEESDEPEDAGGGGDEESENPAK